MSKKLDSSGLAGAVIGSLLGGLALGVITAVLFLRYRRAKSPAPETGSPFEIDPHRQPEVITPFIAQQSADSANEVRPPHEARSSDNEGSSSSAVGRVRRSLLKRGRARAPVRDSASDIFPADTSSSGQPTDSSGPVKSTVQRGSVAAAHEEDDAFATRQLLPPMYQPEWIEDQPRQ